MHAGIGPGNNLHSFQNFCLVVKAFRLDKQDQIRARNSKTQMKQKLDL